MPPEETAQSVSSELHPFNSQPGAFILPLRGGIESEAGQKEIRRLVGAVSKLTTSGSGDDQNATSNDGGGDSDASRHPVSPKIVPREA